LLNPVTIVYFAALILARDAGSLMNTGDRLLFVLGAGLASFSWQTLLAGIGSLAHKHFSHRFQTVASAFGYLIITALGIRIAVQLLV
jgi:arginine exporter protein ArgO